MSRRDDSLNLKESLVEKPVFQEVLDAVLVSESNSNVHDALRTVVLSKEITGEQLDDAALLSGLQVSLRYLNQ
jgi:hypothetical protein